MKIPIFIRDGLLVVLVLKLSSVAFASDPDVRGYWRMDDGNGVELLDSSSYENHGQGRSVRWAQGVLESGLQVNTGGNVDFGRDASLDIEDSITIDAWLKPWNPRYPDRPTVLNREGAYSLHLGPEKEITFNLWLDGKKETVSAPIGEWPAGKWAYFAGTYDGEFMKVFIDGKLANEKAVGSGKKISKSRMPLQLGSIKGRSKYAGTIDEVRLIADALSESEILETFRNGMFNVERNNNMFTSFYEKWAKQDPGNLVPGTLWIETEDFDDYGGWWMDTQFVPEMGSPYLMAAGLHKTVENAKTTIEVPDAGEYRMWVRTKNWLAGGYAPGTFNVLVNGQKADKTFGESDQRLWVWEDGGVFDLDGPTTIELEDLTGFYGRCDVIILTKDMDFVPSREQDDYIGMRRKFVGPEPIEDMGHFDFIVVGGGAAGTNAAIAAARNGVKVALIQNRPMVGGNNSSEMGVPMSGGSSMGRGRESGLNEEFGRIAAFGYNQKWAAGSEVGLANEPNVTVFLNTHVYAASIDEDNRITSVTAFNMLDGSRTRYHGDFFADCTGDAWLGFYAGAQYMIGRETKEKWGEKDAKDVASNITMSGSLMQHSILGYQAIDMGEPIAHNEEEWFYDMRENEPGYLKRPRFENGYRAGSWWTENHGRNDDLWDPEWARDDLLLASMSYYNWIKNYSPLADKAENYKLFYIPVTNAKRETRRLVGDIVVNQNHLVNREIFPDRITYFTWKLDVHHPLGIFSPESPYDYEDNIEPASMPLRMLYSKNVPNMFMAGRNVSVSAVALGSARVQQTTGQMGQVIGTAAAMCVKRDLTPREIVNSPQDMSDLQQQLMKDDLTILHMANTDPNDLARTASISASSSMSEADGPENAIDGFIRPMNDEMLMYIGNEHVPDNMWKSDPSQAMPQWLELDFGEKKAVNSVYLTFDTDLDVKRYITWEFLDEHRMPPTCVSDYRVQYFDGSDWVTVAEREGNYMRRCIDRFDTVETSKIRVMIDKTNGDPSARIYEIRAYNE
ncbi:MAG: FAD-dependent oxidoreductase [Verrucomicrobiota bacterium]